MQFTLPELPDVTLDVTFDSNTQQLSLVGTSATGEVVRASVFVGTIPDPPPPTYVVLDPVLDPDAATAAAAAPDPTLT